METKGDDDSHELNILYVINSSRSIKINSIKEGKFMISIKKNYFKFLGIVAIILALTVGFIWKSVIVVGQGEGMTIPSEPLVMDELFEALTGQGPEQIDGTYNNLGIPSSRKCHLYLN